MGLDYRDPYHTTSDWWRWSYPVSIYDLQILNFRIFLYYRTNTRIHHSPKFRFMDELSGEPITKWWFAACLHRDFTAFSLLSLLFLYCSSMPPPPPSDSTISPLLLLHHSLFFSLSMLIVVQSVLVGYKLYLHSVHCMVSVEYIPATDWNQCQITI